MGEPQEVQLDEKIAKAFETWLLVESILDRLNGDLMTAERDRHDEAAAARVREQIEATRHYALDAEQQMQRFLADKQDGVNVWVIEEIDDEDGSSQFYVSPQPKPDERPFRKHIFALTEAGQVKHEVPWRVHWTRGQAQSQGS